MKIVLIATNLLVALTYCAQAAEYTAGDWMDMHVTLNVENTTTEADDAANLMYVCDDNGENCEWIINY